jgi:hypothetical protein
MWTIEDRNVDWDLSSTLGPLTFLWLGLRRPEFVAVTQCQREHLREPKSHVTKAAKKFGTARAYYE